MSDIVKRLKVLGKGNGRQFSIYTKAADEIENLRAALKPFAGLVKYCEGMTDSESHCVFVGDLRAAAAALKETGDE